jgi:8-oxo-dGTP pyrophosphatase MutT (NUDIX family)
LRRQDSTDYVCDNGHHYSNEPHASTCVVILNDDGKLLLARRGIEPRRDKYISPGGFVEFGEDPYDAARREIREETSLECGELTLLEVRAWPPSPAVMPGTRTKKTSASWRKAASVGRGARRPQPSPAHSA